MSRDLSFGWLRISVRACMILTQLLLVAALAIVAGAAWLAINESTRSMQDLTLVSRGQYHYQHAEALQVALREDVNAAFLLDDDNPQTVETALGRVRDNAAGVTAALNALQEQQLPRDIAERIAALRPLAEAYIGRATALSAMSTRNRDHALELRAGFDDSFAKLRDANDTLAALFAQHTKAGESRAADTATVAKDWILAAATAIALCTCTLVALVGRSMRRSLRQVRDVARALASGDFKVRASYPGTDEVGELTDAVNKMADDLETLIKRLRTDAERDAFGTQLADALEMSDTESEVHTVVARAMSQISSDHAMELLLSDSSRAHLERAIRHPTAGGPGCTVESPFQCVAVRRGSPVVFESSEALNACPRLRDRPCGSISAVCIPISFMGRSIGVLHTTAPPLQPPTHEQASQLKTLGMQIGSRIGTVRAFERTQLQARTDSLTGLSNRRSLEGTVRGLIAQATPYAFVLADLDYFKRLNDRHGHETGDKALRLFAEVFRKSVRNGDLVARWGGEEFAALLPTCTAQEAFEIIERLRAELALAVVVSANSPFTSSFGVADSSMGAHFDDVVRIADCALYASKEAGRDRTTIGDPKEIARSARHESDQDAMIDVLMIAQEN